jgi:uncharacterized membrane protein
VTQPAGWYPDPAGQPGTQRWWDGAHWTEHLQHPQQYVPPAQPGYGAYGQPGGRPGGPDRRILISVIVLAVVLVGGLVGGVLYLGRDKKDNHRTGGGGDQPAVALSRAPAPRQASDPNAPADQKDTGKRRDYTLGSGTGTLGDPDHGLVLPVPVGWQAGVPDSTTGHPATGELATDETYTCPDGHLGCIRGVIRVGTWSSRHSTNLRKDAEDLMAASARTGEFSRLNSGGGSATPFLEKKTTVAGKQAYLARYRFRSGDTLSDTPGTWEVVAFDAGARTGYLYLAFDDVDGAPSAKLFDDYVKAVKAGD